MNGFSSGGRSRAACSGFGLGFSDIAGFTGQVDLILFVGQLHTEFAVQGQLAQSSFFVQPGGFTALFSVSAAFCQLGILLGAGPVSNVLSVTVDIGERHLTTVPGQPGEKAAIAQAFDDGEVFRIDLVDDQATKLMAIIRLIRADHDETPLQLGFVQIENDPPVGVSCVGP